ncbi:MAG: hypothetical protein ACHQ2Z_16310 [Elusimicrobiota bacterium]
MHPEAGWLLPSIRAISWIIFLALWVLVSKWDLKEKKILHRHLRAGLWIAAISYSLMLFSTLLGHWGRMSVYYRWDFYQDLAVYVLTSAFVSVAMWHLRVWPAGDAKLYAFLAVIYPMLSISGSFHSGWLFLDVLINIFIPASVSVFAQAAYYIWRTRVRHQRDFLSQLGFRRGIDFALGRARESAVAAREKARASLAAAAADPRAAAVAALRFAVRWVSSMLVMALISCAVTGLIPTPLLRTVLIFAVFMAWRQFQNRLDRRVSALLVAGVAAALFLRGDPTAVARELFKSFGYLSLFSVCLSVGMKMSMGIMRGQVVMFAFPLLMGLFGMVASRLRPEAGWAATVLPLAAMGLFFGISFVFVRIWDDEDHPDIPLERLLSYMVLHRSFHKQLSEDRDFYQNHFESSYADGLTAEQVEALKAWCSGKGIATVPLTTTMSFAHWIFLGYFVTWALGGSVLKAF